MYSQGRDESNLSGGVVIRSVRLIHRRLARVLLAEHEDSIGSSKVVRTVRRERSILEGRLQVREHMFDVLKYEVLSLRKVDTVDQELHNVLLVEVVSQDRSERPDLP